MEKVVAYIVNARILAVPRKTMGKILDYAVSSRNAVIVYYATPDKAKVMSLIRQIHNETELLIGDNESYQIFMAVARTRKIKGDLAEVGVYKGGSAKLICEAKGKQALHLFDTFEGLPELHKADDPGQFYRGQFHASFKPVKNYLKKYPNVHFYKGLFPSTAGPIMDKRFSFVNLDVDIYKSTLNCIKFFYPRMNRGGVMISHDYTFAHGVKRAFDEFFKDKPEPVFELSGSQCMVVKL